jgi:tetratricopeptide (TPR) repeat protein
MSLIHDALRDMNRPANAPAARMPAPAAHRRSEGRNAVVAFMVVVVLGGGAYAGWIHWREPVVIASAAKPEAPPAARPIAKVLIATSTATLAVAAEPVAAPGLSAVALAVAPAAAETATPATSPRTPEPAGTERVARAPIKRTKSTHNRITRAPQRNNPIASIPARGAASDGMPPEQRFGQFLAAMRAANLPEAERHLAALRLQLRPDSVSLLRAEAWMATSRGEHAVARRKYQDVLERIPGDEEASINLASIEAAQKKPEVARQILAEALRVSPDSDALKAALAGFRGQP